MKKSSTILSILLGSLVTSPLALAEPLSFPEGTATPSAVCGACHHALHKEYTEGFGADLQYRDLVLKNGTDPLLNLPTLLSRKATAHAFAGSDPFPIHARESEEEGRACNSCHFPEPFAIPDIKTTEITKPTPRPREKELGGLTCASCHLTPEGKIRSAHAVEAPHATVVEPAIQTSAMCAACHSLGKRVAGKQSQTFFEWRDDFFLKGLGRQHCQDCHMPRTERPVAEESSFPPRAVARHLWTGGHSLQRLIGALSLVTVRPQPDSSTFEFHLINIGAGHSVPTGSNRRALTLSASVVDTTGKRVANHEWLFAPWYGSRPDDKSYLAEDSKRLDSVAAAQADAQGPHEPPIRAGEERIIPWEPDLAPGEYTLTTKLVYDLNRYNDPKFSNDQTEISQAAVRFALQPANSGELSPQ